MNAEGKLKKCVLEEVERRGLTSLMNNTKWREFCNAMYEDLPFPPAYARKDVLEVDYKPFSEDVWYIGDYDEGIHPYHSIEWIEVRPRRVISRGRLVKGEIESIEEQFVEVLKKYSIPHEYQKNSYIIYGYASNISEIVR